MLATQNRLQLGSFVTFGLLSAKIQPYGHYKGVLQYFRVCYGNYNFKENKKYRIQMTFDLPKERDDQFCILTTVRLKLLVQGVQVFSDMIMEHYLDMLVLDTK